MKCFLALLLLFSMLFLPTRVFSEVYWVSPTGKSSWLSAQSITPLNGTSCASLKTANDNASAGDTIYLRGGVYNTSIMPLRSGTAITDMIIYQAYAKETPVITGTNSYGTFFGILLTDKHYLKIDGITIKDVDRWMNIRAGSSHIEVANCVFTDSDGRNITGINIWGQCNGGASFNCPVSHIWFHHNTVYNAGWVGNNCNDEGSLMYVGSPTQGDSNSNYITIENNTFYRGGHHLLETFTKFNVIKGNYFHNEGFMPPPSGMTCDKSPGSNGLYGNRCVHIYDGHNQDGNFNLIEGNRFGTTGCPPDDNGGNSFKLVSRKNITRYNYIFNSAGDGIYFKQGYFASSDSNVVYNNTIFKTGQAPASRTDFRRNGISIHGKSLGNKIKNNLIYDYQQKAIALLGAGSLSNSVIEGNWTWDDGDPMFFNTDVSNPFVDTLPNLKLKPGSPCKERGVHLTTTTTAATNSSTLQVESAMYFQDGTWGSSLAELHADWIAIGSSVFRVQIVSVNYKNNTIKLAKPMSWKQGAKVWLFRQSSGKCVLMGNTSDIGADETYY